MREQFQEISFYANARFMIAKANEIIDEYQAQGLTLTLRQLYYQFVSRDLLPNTQRSYDNLGSTISKARLAGFIDWDAIEDRTRFLRGVNTFNSPQEMVRHGLRGYAIDMWANQDYRPEVWIEKDALVGVIEGVCVAHGVNFFACRGYVSQSELYSAAGRLKEAQDSGQTPIVLHLGDHDPSGLDMTRDNRERLEMFCGFPVEVRRLALNLDQVRRYNPPPNPAKMSDVRAGEYVRKYGNQSWELDALEPKVLHALIEDAILDMKDELAWGESEDRLEQHKKTIRKAIAYMDKQK